jgi:hypothetical protein
MPIGTTAAIIGGASAAGSLASGLSSIFGDDDGAAEPKRGERIRQIFEERYQRLRDQSPGQTEQFTAGVGALRDQAEREARRDASQAAARGLEGSQFAVAQDESRARALAQSTRDLFQQSARSLQQRRQSALRGLAEQSNRLDQFDAEQRRLERRREGRLGEIAGAGLQAATQFALSGNGSGGGGG